MDFFDEDLYTAKEVTEITKLSEDKLMEYAKAGYAPCITVDGEYYFKSRIFSWIKKNFVHVQKGMTFPERLTIFVNQPAPGLFMEIPPALRKLEGLKQYEFWHFPPCVYFLCHGKEIVYIGQAINLPRRVIEHFQSGEKIFDHVYFFEVPEGELNRVERMFISEIKTKYNKENFRASMQELKTKQTLSE